MSKYQTLVAELEQFIYQYAPQMLNKKTMLSIAQNWESAYKDRITELESQLLTRATNFIVENRDQNKVNDTPRRMWPEDDTDNQF